MIARMRCSTVLERRRRMIAVDDVIRHQASPIWRRTCSLAWRCDSCKGCSTMPRTNPRPAASAIERTLGEASWLLSHAQALADYGRTEEGHAELARAALAEEQAASLLEAAG